MQSTSIMLIIDRIEGSVAVVEDGGMTKNIPLELIDGRARDGAVLVRTSNGRYQVDEETGEHIKRKNTLKLHQLFNKGKGSEGPDSIFDA